MSIEKPTERLERAEAYLKQRLSDYKEIMPVKWWKEVTLLEIYWEWMNYLVKEKIKGRSDLLLKWQRFLLERNTDAIADLLIGFFEAKRRYGRDLGRNEDRWDWFALCRNYCRKNGWYNDEDLLHSFFSSYSGAERRIYKKAEEGKVLADTSKSILQIMELTQSEMIKKEEEKKRKAEEKKLKEEEKQRRKEERAKKAEEKKLKKEQRNKPKKIEPVTDDIENNVEKENDEEEIHEENAVDEWAVNHYGGNDRDIVNEDGDVIPNPAQMHISQKSIIEPKESEVKDEDGSSKPPKLDEDGQQYLIDFPEFDD